MLFLMTSCQTSDQRFKPKFEFLDSPDGEVKACLSRKDVIDLRRVLNNCSKK